MTSGTYIDARTSGQRRRLSLVVALVFGLLASLIHCASCDTAIAGSASTVVAMDFNGSPIPDAPDHKMAVHSGHCLSHVTEQPTFVVHLPVDVAHRTRPLGREQTLASLAGLPLFKPPRA